MHIRTDSVHSSIGSRALGVHTSTLDVDKVGNEAELQGDFAGLSSRLKVSGKINLVQKPWKLPKFHFRRTYFSNFGWGGLFLALGIV